VAGAGIAGLTAAYRISRSRPAPRVVLVEAGDRLGGKILTEAVGGFVIEAGPDSLLTHKPHALALAAEVGVADWTSPVANEHGLLVLRHGRLHRAPEGMTGVLPQRFAPVARSRMFSPAGKCRMALEYALPARGGDHDESVKSFVTRRLGRQVYDRLVEPLTAGVFMTDPSTASVMATMPQLHDAEIRHGGLLRAMLATARTASTPEPGRAQSHPSPGVVAPGGGMERLVASIAGHLVDVDLRLNTAVEAVERRERSRHRDGRYLAHLRRSDGHREPLAVDAVVLAVPATAAAALTEPLDSDLSATLQTTTGYTSTATVSMGFTTDLSDRLPGHGYLVPVTEQRLTRACSWTSVKFPGRCADGHTLARISLGGAGRPPVEDLSDEALLDTARHELSDILGIHALPAVSRVHRWSRVIPHYRVGHPQRLAALHHTLRSFPGLVVAGSGYHGLSIPDCISSAQAAAHAVTTHLEAP